MTTQLAIDAGQTGIRTLLVVDGVRGDEAERPGILTSEPLLPQLAAVIRDASAPGPIDVVSIGTTGLTADQNDPSALRALVPERDVAEVLIAHDSVTSYLGALGDTRGAVVAVGTGVVTLAVGATDVARVDGWGHLIGDAGSGYWIGRAALDAVMRAHDGRGEPTALTARVLEEFPDLEEIYIELQSDPARVRRIAAYTRVVAELAATDAVSARICADAGRELALSVVTGLSRVGEGAQEAPVVCGVGGVLRSDAVTVPFAQELRSRWEGVSIRPPLGSGIDGAALLPRVATTSALYPLIARS